MRVYRVIDESLWRDGAERDPLPPPRHRAYAGFDDLTNLLGPGVYILERDGVVVFVAWAKNVLDRLNDHRKLADQSMPSWFPVKGIVYDRAHFRRCASDIGDRIVSDLIAQYDPPLNRPNAHATLPSA